jgi:hypothetical protein
VSDNLTEFVENSGWPTRTSCDWLVAGIACHMSVNAWLEWREEEKKVPLPAQSVIVPMAPKGTEAALREACFFAGQLVERDTMRTNSIAVVLAAAWRRMYPQDDPDDWIRGDWACELGWYLFAEAIGMGIAWDDDNPEHGLQPPDWCGHGGDWEWFDMKEAREDLASELRWNLRKKRLAKAAGNG